MILTGGFEMKGNRLKVKIAQLELSDPGRENHASRKSSAL